MHNYKQGLNISEMIGAHKATKSNSLYLAQNFEMKESSLISTI